jgi:hypothetical protein
MSAVSTVSAAAKCGCTLLLGVETVRRTPSSSMNYHPEGESYRGPTEMHLNALLIVLNKSAYITSPRE